VNHRIPHPGDELGCYCGFVDPIFIYAADATHLSLIRSRPLYGRPSCLSRGCGRRASLLRPVNVFRPAYIAFVFGLVEELPHMLCCVQYVSYFQFIAVPVWYQQHSVSEWNGGIQSIYDTKRGRPSPVTERHPSRSDPDFKGVTGHRGDNEGGRIRCCPGLLLVAQLNRYSGIEIEEELEPVNRLSVGIVTGEVVLQKPIAAGLFEGHGSSMHNGTGQPG